MWEYRPPGGVALTASVLTTGGGLVFTGTADRRLFALDHETGELLWETRLNGDISGAPVTFEVDGRQYLAVGAGGRIGMTTSYARFTDTTIPQGSGVMWVFALPRLPGSTDAASSPDSSRNTATSWRLWARPSTMWAASEWVRRSR